MNKKNSALSLSSLRPTPSAPDFRALPRAFLCHFQYLANIIDVFLKKSCHLGFSKSFLVCIIGV